MIYTINKDTLDLAKKELKKNPFDIRSVKYYKALGNELVRAMIHSLGAYNVPTIEMVNWLKNEIKGKKVIEIGAGNGMLAKALDIIATDNYLQTKADIKLLYKFCEQPTVQYGEYVHKMDAIDAVKYYKPDLVIGCWVTDQNNAKIGGGIDEEYIIKNCDYLFVGNKITHRYKTILKYEHEEIIPSFELVSRLGISNDNVILKWNKI